MKAKNLMQIALLGVITLLFAANPAKADEGFSVGASVARADVEASGLGVNVNGDATGWRVFGLYMFNDKYGIEGGYRSFGRPDDNTIPSNIEVGTDGFDLYAVGTYPVSEKFDLIGKLGFVSSSTEIELDEATEASQTNTDLALGFGGEYGVSERFAVRAEFEWINNQDFGATNMIALSGVFQF